MNITIIGAGVVGKATGEGFKRFGHVVTYRDKGESPVVEDTRIYFICTPEDAVPDIVEKLREANGYTVIRSSVLPGTTSHLQEQFSMPLFHNPEFLREAVAEDDFLYSERTIVGYSWQSDTTGLHKREIEKLYNSIGKSVVWCDPIESEMAKLITNCHLATLISFWNELKVLCDSLEVNSHRVARLVTLDSRISWYGAYKHGARYGGRCLPKDIDQILGLARDLSITLPLLEAAKNQNTGVA